MNKILVLILILFLNISSSFAKNLTYNFLDTNYIPIKLSPCEEISSAKNIYEGEVVEFKIVEDVYKDKKLFLQKDLIVCARIETIITSGMNGFPAEIIIDNFKIPNINKSQLISTITETGTNRCIWVYPLKWALTPIPFAGSTTNLIKGGHAKLKTNEVVTIYYFPNWK